LSALLSFGVALLVLLTHQLGSEFVGRSIQLRLEAVATLKASIIKAWIADNGDDIRLWSSSPDFSEALTNWRSAGRQDAEARLRLLGYLWQLSEALHYVEVGLRDARTGELLLTTSGDDDSPEVRAHAIAAANSARPVLEDIHVDSDAKLGSRRYLGYFSAVRPAGGSAPVVIHIGVDPDHEFFPLLARWPGPSESAEVLLLRRSGSGFVVLNDPKPRYGSPPQSPRTLAFSSATADRLALGGQGYIGDDPSPLQAMLAFAQPVAGTPWIVVARISRQEAYADLDRIDRLAASLIALMLVIGVGWWFQHQRHLAAARELDRERADQADNLARLSRRIVSVQEEERRRLAAELHDRTATNLAAIGLNLKRVVRTKADAAGVDDALMQETQDLLTDTIVSIREFCVDLRPAILDYAGLAQALENSVAQFSRRTGIAAQVDLADFSGRCTPEQETVLFRIAQEALMNCAKHSRASQVQVRLAREDDGQLTLTIADDGTGFDPAALGQTGADQDVGSGLLNMRERAAFAGGELQLESAPGQGTRITIRIAG
jgi:signal transduction histidine kinase